MSTSSIHSALVERGFKFEKPIYSEATMDYFKRIDLDDDSLPVCELNDKLTLVVEYSEITRKEIPSLPQERIESYIMKIRAELPTGKWVTLKVTNLTAEDVANDFDGHAEVVKASWTAAFNASKKMLANNS